MIHPPHIPDYHWYYSKTQISLCHWCFTIKQHSFSHIIHLTILLVNVSLLTTLYFQIALQNTSYGTFIVLTGRISYTSVTVIHKIITKTLHSHFNTFQFEYWGWDSILILWNITKKALAYMIFTYNQKRPVFTYSE